MHTIIIVLIILIVFGILIVWSMYNRPNWKEGTITEYRKLVDIFGYPSFIRSGSGGGANWIGVKPYSFIMISDKSIKNCCNDTAHTILAVLEIELLNVSEILPSLSLKNIAYSKNGQVLIECDDVKSMIKSTKFVQYILTNPLKIKDQYAKGELMTIYDNIVITDNKAEIDQLAKDIPNIPRTCNTDLVDCKEPLGYGAVKNYVNVESASSKPVSMPTMGKFDYEKNIGKYKLGVPSGYLVDGKDPKRPSYVVKVNEGLSDEC